MTTVEMPNKYQPHEVEAGRYDKWLKQGVFEPNGDKGVEPVSYTHLTLPTTPYV